MYHKSEVVGEKNLENWQTDSGTLSYSHSRLVRERAFPDLDSRLFFHCGTKKSPPVFKQVSLDVLQGELLVFSEKGVFLSQKNTLNASCLLIPLVPVCFSPGCDCVFFLRALGLVSIITPTLCCVNKFSVPRVLVAFSLWKITFVPVGIQTFCSAVFFLAQNRLCLLLQPKQQFFVGEKISVGDSGWWWSGIFSDKYNDFTYWFKKKKFEILWGRGPLFFLPLIGAFP